MLFELLRQWMAWVLTLLVAGVVGLSIHQAYRERRDRLRPPNRCGSHNVENEK